MIVRGMSRKVVAVETEEGAGARVRRVFPTQHLTHFDPFVLLDEFFVEPPAGFPSHPHKGFEAVTYMIEGGFHHKDNFGNDTIVLAGGVQRFTAGKEIVHSELPGMSGLNRGLQLWIRLSSKLRDVKSDYQQVEPSAIPEEKLDGASIRIIVGRGSPVKLRTEVVYLDVKLPPKKEFVYNINSKFNMMLYVLEGALGLGKSQVGRGEAALLTTGERVEVAAEEKARLALIGGRPHGETIVLRGSFVY